MKLLYFSDAHIRASTPRNRRDNYPDALWDKFRQITELILDHDIDIVLINGDLFDTPDPATSLVNKYLELFTYWDVPIYATTGSHDKFGYNDSTIARSGLGTLIAAGVVTLISETRRIKNVQIAGVSHSYNLDENPLNYTRKRLDNSFMVQINHGMILDKPFVTTHTRIQDVQTDADLSLCGHYHPGFGPINLGGTTWLNVGSLGRTERTSRVYNPSVVLIDSARRDFNIIELNTATHDEIFIETAEMPQTFIDVGEFIDALKHRIDGFHGGDLKELIVTIGKENKCSSTVIARALQYIEEIKCK